MFKFLQTIKAQPDPWDLREELDEWLKASAKDPVNEENKRILMLIDVTDTQELEDMDENDKKEYVAKASEIFQSSVFKNELKRLAQSQLEFVALQSQTWEENILGRGNVNGLGLVMDRFQLLDGMHKENTKRTEEPSKDIILPEV